MYCYKFAAYLCIQTAANAFLNAGVCILNTCLGTFCKHWFNVEPFGETYIRFTDSCVIVPASYSSSHLVIVCCMCYRHNLALKAKTHFFLNTSKWSQASKGYKEKKNNNFYMVRNEIGNQQGRNNNTSSAVTSAANCDSVSIAQCVKHDELGQMLFFCLV